MPLTLVCYISRRSAINLTLFHNTWFRPQKPVRNHTFLAPSLQMRCDAMRLLKDQSINQINHNHYPNPLQVDIPILYTKWSRCHPKETQNTSHKSTHPKIRANIPATHRPKYSFYSRCLSFPMFTTRWSRKALPSFFRPNPPLPPPAREKESQQLTLSLPPLDLLPAFPLFARQGG